MFFHLYLLSSSLQFFCPESIASYFSKITFSWFTELIFKARRVRALQQSDLWHLHATNLASAVAPPFERLLDRWSARQKQGKPSLPAEQVSAIRYLMSIYWCEFAIICLIKLVASMFIFVNPIVLDWIINFMNPANNEPQWRGFLYTTLMFLSPMFESFATNQHEYRINQLTMKMKTAITSAVYRKSLRLSNTSRQQYTTGEIVNFIMVDCQRVVDFFNQINTVWSAPLQIVIGVYLLYVQLNVAAFAGFSFMLVIMPLNVWITRQIKKIQSRMMVEKDGRSKLMDEILNGIKLIKLSAWEAHFERKLLNFRNREVAQLKVYAWYNTMLNSIFSSAVFFVALISFLTFTLMSSDNILDANKAFVSLALFNIVRIPLAFLPMVLSAGGIAIVSMRRIDRYLSSPEIDDNLVMHLRQATTPELESDEAEDEEKEVEQPEVIRINDGSFSWDSGDSEPILKDVNLSIKKGQLIAVIGGVGAGKSSLLSTLLGDMVKLSGAVHARGKIAFVPQEAWIRNASIRENIIMNKRYDEKRYRAVLDKCELQFDMAMFAAGDATEVGEKGINLSGGQRQRISIARAVYSNSDIYLFDDPISALDAHVGKNIFDKVVGPKGCLGNKTRVLVTHKLSLLTQVDQIIYIDNATIAEMGTFNQLINNAGPFSEYVAEYFLNQNEIHKGGEEDQDELQFRSQLQSQIKPVIDRVELSRSLSTGSNLGRSQLLSSKSMGKLSQSSIHRSARLTQSQEGRGRLIKKEEVEEGSVKIANHIKYFQTVGYYVCFNILFGFTISNAFQVLGSLWLSDWSNDALDPVKAIDLNQRYIRIAVYSVLGIFEAVFSFVGTLLINIYCVVASKLLHNQMLHCILRVPMSFFDTTPIGRIMNRFSRDIDIIDLQISLNVRLLSMQIFRLIVAFGLIALEAPAILFFLFPLTLMYYIVQRLYINTSRQLKRIEAVTRSPLNNFLGESINGAVSIRCYGLVKTFMREMNRRIDENNRSYWLNFTAARWLAVRLEFLSYTIVFIATVFAVFSKGTITPGIAGLAISYSLNITSILNIFIRGSTELETNFVSVERITEYTELETEKSFARKLAPRGWPNRGEIVFSKYSTQYRPGLPMCLKGIDIVIQPGSKVAIVGRTGSGKSSLLLALFRLLPAVEGAIYVDNINIEHIGLKELRSSMRIVPQDPVIFSGTIRDNIDILGQHNDQKIVESLDKANLHNFLESIDNNLDYEITAGSDRLSKGQRQLVTLARGLIDESKIIVFDESTSGKFPKQTHTFWYFIDNIFNGYMQTNTKKLWITRPKYISTIA